MRYFLMLNDYPSIIERVLGQILLFIDVKAREPRIIRRNYK